MKQKYITLLPISLLALSASYGIYSFSLLFVPWYIAGITALAFELTYVSLVFIDSTKAKRVSIMAVIVSVLWNVGHSMFVLYPASVEMVYSSVWLSFVLAAIHGVPLATLAYLVADVSLHISPPTKHDTVDVEINNEIDILHHKINEIGLLLDEIYLTEGETEGEINTESSEIDSSIGVKDSEITRNEKIILDKQSGMTYTELSTKYGVSKRRIQQIVKGL